MSFDEALEAAVRRAVEPLAVEVRQARAELAALRAALPPPTASVEEAARRAGRSTRWVRDRIKDGSVSAKRAGRCWLVDLASLRPTDDETVARLAREAQSR